MPTISGSGASAQGLGWQVTNNPWGSGSLTYGTDYTMSITYDAGNLANHPTFSWSYPALTAANRYTVFAYPEITFGSSPWWGQWAAADPLGVFPVSLANLASLEINYDIGLTGFAGGHNVAFEIWLTDTPNGGSAAITNEVMVQLHIGPMYGSSAGAGTFSSGTYTGTIYNNLNWASGWTFTVVQPGTTQPGADALSGSFDLAVLLTQLKAQGLVKGNEYIAGLEFGAEVTAGTGSMTFNKLEYDVTLNSGLTTILGGTTGRAGNDRIQGSNDADTLTGLAGDDQLYGFGGNDTLRGGAGNNTLDGGDGTDTVALAGKPGDYFIETATDGTLTVIGAGETDTLKNIEQASFDATGQTLSLAAFQSQSFSTLQALEYIASYKDLMGAFGDDAVWGARHYFNNGKAEGRTISFNALNYIASYGDLIVAFHDDQLAATEHYLKNGSYEGRKVTFDPLAYVCSYSDLLIAFHDDKAAAAEHYIRNGYWENRKVTFDALAYVCSYDDLVIAFHNDKTAAEEHYIRNGYWEGRKVTFNALAYIASYTDLIGAFGTDVQAAEEHYIRNGFWEGRKVTFDPVAYLINNTDLGTCGFTAADVTEHYLKNGYWEHRTTNGAFGSEQTNHDLIVGGSVTDTIGTAGDKDWFAVSVTAGQTYTFTLSGVDGGNGTLADPFLSICDAHGVQLTYANDSTNHDAVIRFTALSTGTCYLVASANDTGTGSYKLFATAGG
ncbi:pre-peptidase C-terminal domain-containing protein [Rhizomicrobium electricum]|uniref:Peptidase C-terminal archaeal/bacterial domain-containing protein n=1 Tax=Rhizomicrobium electricum TaxID=480070 RepID=A0ABP3PB44_9PROT|nr:pre-peptidase C-terminal domain-containing protein [Rhizomicrobium electricum]NIJ48242.1 Ca2+-binding RTX toxin-like protein [Rhizomicrobium electricum]